MTAIFISYRRDDAGEVARTLAAKLGEAFGAGEVFLDTEAMHAGDFRDQIDVRLRDCKCLVVVIGRQWLSAADKQRRQRIQLADDVHRHEIASALRMGLTVLPVLVDRAAMPEAEQLPDDIKRLAKQNAREFGDTQARRGVDVAAIVGDIAKVAGVRTLPAWRKPSPSLRSRTVWPIGAGLTLTVVAATAVFVSGMQPLTTQELIVLAFALCMAFYVLAWLRARKRAPRS